MPPRTLAAPTPVTRISNASPAFTAPPTRPAPRDRSSVRLSPLKSASLTVAPALSRMPSAGSASPARTRTRSPGRSRAGGDALDVSRGIQPPGALRRAARDALERACGARTRKVLEVTSPSSRKTNIVTESKYTAPVPRNVAHALAANATASPSATGMSIPARAARRSRHAPRKKGAAEYAITGAVSASPAQRMRPRRRA
jgi:hypothetical protein